MKRLLPLAGKISLFVFMGKMVFADPAEIVTSNPPETFSLFTPSKYISTESPTETLDLFSFQSVISREENFSEGEALFSSFRFEFSSTTPLGEEQSESSQLAESSDEASLEEMPIVIVNETVEDSLNASTLSVVTVVEEKNISDSPEKIVSTAPGALNEFPRFASEVSTRAVSENSTSANKIVRATTSETGQQVDRPSMDLAIAKELKNMEVGPPAPKKIRVRLTFYSGQDDQWGSRVAWNKVAQAQLGRTAAADPNLFPYGTWIHIPGFGVHRVEDTGTAVKSRKASGGAEPVIDLYVGEESEVNRLSQTVPEYVEITLL